MYIFRNFVVMSTNYRVILSEIFRLMLAKELFLFKETEETFNNILNKSILFF